MLKRIEISNFENYEHAVFDDLSPGFNLICGDSNVGKSSCVRFLKMICYHDFDQKSVRVGNINCGGAVTTERGTVKVTRGRDNIWEVTDATGRTETFRSIGKGILPQAADILGLKTVKLGDIELSANIMDQLEGHFMMAELDGKSASGSMRAQVVDEISGLAGAESLVREIVLDNTRLARDKSTKDEESASLKTQLHPKDQLEAEAELLVKAAKLIEQHDAGRKTIDAAGTVLDSHHRSKQHIEALERDFLLIPDLVSANTNITAAVDLVGRFGSMLDLNNTAVAATQMVKVVESKLRSVPQEIDRAVLVVAGVPDSLKRQESIETTIRQHEAVWTKQQDVEQQLFLVPQNLDAVANNLRTVENHNSIMRSMQVVHDSFTKVKREAADVQRCLLAAEREFDDLKRQEVELLQQVELCPLTMKPITQGCRV